LFVVKKKINERKDEHRIFYLKNTLDIRTFQENFKVHIDTFRYFVYYTCNQLKIKMLIFEKKRSR